MTEGNYGKPQQDSWSPGRDLNPGPPEYEAGALTTRPRCLVGYCGDEKSAHLFKNPNCKMSNHVAMTNNYNKLV
jgi:hypothetical protein